MRAYAFFDSDYAPCGFLIVPEDASPYDDSHTVLIQTDWDFPGVATSMGWQACSQCGATDGTVNCEHRTASDMIAEAYDWIREHDGELFEALTEYLDHD